ncbi:caspase family protein [Streptomyces sp. NPDC051080]|uniref:caspase family protein n=1 Tax=Streptomyces sp. NPDC051080 TaxID=3157222 RepID=UPI00343BDDD8
MDKSLSGQPKQPAANARLASCIEEKLRLDAGPALRIMAEELESSVSDGAISLIAETFADGEREGLVSTIGRYLTLPGQRRILNRLALECWTDDPVFQIEFRGAAPSPAHPAELELTSAMRDMFNQSSEFHHRIVGLERSEIELHDSILEMYQHRATIAKKIRPDGGSNHAIDLLRDLEMMQAASGIPPLHLPTWKKGAAVLVGTYEYEHLADVPSIKNNLSALASLLHTGFGIPERNIHCVDNPKSRADIQGVIHRARQAVDPVSGALLVYYSGHGWTDPLGRLQLGLAGSKQKEPWTAFPFSGIREQLADSQIATRIVILDACYSGAALDLLSGETPTSTAIEGSYVMTSSDDNNASLARDGDLYTAFTGEIVKALTEGIPGAGGVIGIDALFSHVRGIFEAHEWPVPDRQIRTDGAKIQLMRNRWRKT